MTSKFSQLLTYPTKVDRALVPILFDAIGVLLTLDFNLQFNLGAMTAFQREGGADAIAIWVDGPASGDLSKQAA